MTARSPRLVRVGLWMVVLVGLLSGCAAPVAPQPDASTTAAVISVSPAAAPQPTPPTAPVASAAAAWDADAVAAGIQSTLDQYAQAYSDLDAALLRETVDGSNPAFKRLVTGSFDQYQSSFASGLLDFEYTVQRVERRDVGFVQAQLRDGYNTTYDWTFREVDGRWLLSEPTEKQLGQRHTTETDHFTFYSYDWSSAVNPRIFQLMERARTRVAAQLGKTPEAKITVTIRPIFGMLPTMNALYAAYYRPSSRARTPDSMLISAPGSFAYGGYDAGAGWEQDLEDLLTHEFTHFTAARAFGETGRISPWMSEGLAEFVAGRTHQDDLQYAVADNTIIPIMDQSGAIHKQDLEHMTLLNQDMYLAYGFSYSLVRFVVDEHGGLDGFWKLAAAYDDYPNLDGALQQAFGMSYDQFDQEWRAWLKATYS